MKLTSFVPEFHHYIPEEIHEGVLYISLEYDAVIHLCFCGCGKKVHTPLGLNWWVLTKNENGVTLRPSVGSWQIPCRSHYHLTDNVVEWL